MANENIMTKEERIKGGLYGMLIGDALGVPYEFHYADELPPIEKIEMTPPRGFSRTYSGVKPGTWSDDGAMALCLLDSLLEKGRLDLKNLAGKFLGWYDKGLWAVGGDVFDVGTQTSIAITAFAQGEAPEKCGFVRPNGKGNGSLMRVLPLALWHKGSDAELARDAHRQSTVTHGHITNQVCCALYCLAARELLGGSGFDGALAGAVKKLRVIYSDKPEYSAELEYSLRPDEPDAWTGTGTGFVVDCLRSAFMIMKDAACFEDAAKRAVALGSDTDTTACVTCGLAGIRFGFGDIPSRWTDALREREKVDAIFERLMTAVNG